MNGAGVPRTRAPSAARSSPTNRSPNERLLQPTRRSSTPGSDTSPRPPARWRRRRPSKAAGCRAPVTRLGVELPLCGPPGSDQASQKRERPARTRGGYSRRTARLAENPERFRLAPCPKARVSTYRANGEAVERTRVPSRRPKPRLVTAARRRLRRSRTKASFFRARDGEPWTERTAARTAEKPPR
jgi:hypothetical protein